MSQVRQRNSTRSPKLALRGFFVLLILFVLTSSSTSSEWKIKNLKITPGQPLKFSSGVVTAPRAKYEWIIQNKEVIYGECELSIDYTVMWFFCGTAGTTIWDFARDPADHLNKFKKRREHTYFCKGTTTFVSETKDVVVEFNHISDSPGEFKCTLWTISDVEGKIRHP